MGAHIYGTYHGRFKEGRHPVNRKWSIAQNGLAWLLEMSWTEFDSFNQAALPEYLDLLTEDLADIEPGARIMMDGGICNPVLIAQVISPSQMVCLARPEPSSADIWRETNERNSMKEIVYQLQKPEEAWRKFLEFDNLIAQTILKECRESQITVCIKKEAEGLDEFAEKVATALGICSNYK
jgi:hypothetical protein